MRPPPLRRALGQHHLIDGRACAPLIEFLQPSGCRVIEIGPGGGVLTGELLRAGARLMALELDPRWAFELVRRLRGQVPALAVADAVSVAWSRLAGGTLVAGNLPYAVGTAIVERVLRQALGVPRAAFLLQLEVAQRLTAGPGSRAYGSLSVVAGAYAEARLLGRVKPGSFHPPPRVESAFVGLLRRPPPLSVDAMGPFLAWVRELFVPRRKTLRNALRRLRGTATADAELAAAGVDGVRRAEELGLEELVRLYQAGAPGDGSAGGVLEPGGP